MPRSKSSQRWLKEHFDDHWVTRAKAEGYRSRASYKLIEIDEKDRLLKPGMTVLDLGAAPGGWSQVAAARCLNGSSKNRAENDAILVASDILPMDAIAGVTFIQGDFREAAVFDGILAALGNRKVDLVMSDMAPNISGNRSVDQPRAVYLCELALDMAVSVLAPEGRFLVKLFQGQGADEFRHAVQQRFRSLVTRKPAASRARSNEVYLLAQGLRMT
jgi:23S rRNA (uridine2552-2'-O)-methyltransferase